MQVSTNYRDALYFVTRPWQWVVLEYHGQLVRRFELFLRKFVPKGFTCFIFLNSPTCASDPFVCATHSKRFVLIYPTILVKRNMKHNGDHGLV